MSIFPKDFDPTYQDYVTKFLEYEEETEDYLWNKGDLLVEFTGQPFTDGVSDKAMLKGLRSLASDVMRHHKTLERWRFTALIFPPVKRIADLSFSHHTAAAYSKVPEYWIQEAADKEWSTYQLKQAIKEAEHPEEAWVSKTIRGEAHLHTDKKGYWATLESEDMKLRFHAAPEDPICLRIKYPESIDVEVEASIRVRRKDASKEERQTTVT